MFQKPSNSLNLQIQPAVLYPLMPQHKGILRLLSKMHYKMLQRHSCHLFDQDVDVNKHVIFIIIHGWYQHRVCFSESFEILIQN